MSAAGYDAIVVGARCAGSPTAMLLARRGYRVLLLDKATFPSDTMSTHLVHPPGVAALERWGLLERLVATGCPPVETYSFDFGPLTIAGSPRPVDGIARAYCPRRTVLDELLVEAAVEAGAELREGFTVDEISSDNGTVTGIRGHATEGGAVTERARVVIGADGKHSLVAKTVKPDEYNERRSHQAMYYAYWSNLPSGGFETTIRTDDRRGWAAVPTHDDLTVLPFGWPIEEFHANRKDIEGNFFAAMDLVPEFAERVRAATRESKFVGSAELPGYFRKPFGPGWALLGDAGYHKNPITAMGINDAFRDAELVAGALDDAFSGRRSYEEGMSEYQEIRDRAAMPIYEFTDEFAQLQPPPPEMQQLIGAMHGNQQAMDDFVSVQAATLPAPEFFAPENVGRIMAEAGMAARDG
ncbi:MAG TPA: NAD(P)/FAD-dependent oxidoreductase [Solirubrobacterales bacterium]|nr:NAD(P)/FAD-dependent oxidoreductase [Solirubrobacterales bacterium]